LLFLIAPGLWRNVCPMASLNQLPRALGCTRGWTLPSRVQQNAPLVSAGLFLLILPLRKITLDHDGEALAAFLLALLGLAFVGGFAFKGKSGWCTQFCPMLQVERFYGQSPSSWCGTAIAGPVWAAPGTVTTPTQRRPT